MLRISDQSVAFTDWTDEKCTPVRSAVLLMGRAHSGYECKSNIATPHVFMARATERTPRMFMTKPVFTWENKAENVRRGDEKGSRRVLVWVLMLASYHVFDHEMSWRKGDWVWWSGHRQHEGVWTSYCCRNHEVQRVYWHANSLQGQRQNKEQHIYRMGK